MGISVQKNTQKNSGNQGFNRVIHVRLTEQDYKNSEQLAKTLNTTRSELFRKFLQERLESKTA